MDFSDGTQLLIISEKNDCKDNDFDSIIKKRALKNYKITCKKKYFIFQIFTLSLHPI